MSLGLRLLSLHRSTRSVPMTILLKIYNHLGEYYKQVDLYIIFERIIKFNYASIGEQTHKIFISTR